MKLVYITSGFPFPLTSGYLRHFHFLERLARIHDITLFSLVGPDHTPEHRARVEALGVDVRTFPATASRWRRSEAAIAMVAPDIVVGRARRMRRAVADFLADEGADAAFLSGKTTSGCLGALVTLPILVDACDATSMRLEAQLEHRSGFARLTGRVRLRSMRRIERRLRRSAEHVIVASERDVEYLGWTTDTTVVPNGVDIAYWTRSLPERTRDLVVFTGKMSYGPNEDAALRLIDDIMPLVRERRPGARLRIVGMSPTERLREAGQAVGVEVTGSVPDMRPHLAAATVFAAPIRFGAGIQNKVLEALAMELPVVGSNNATAGLVVDGATPPVDVADSPAATADAVVAALDAADNDPSPISINREWVVERFDWDTSAARIDAILRRIQPNPKPQEAT